MLADYKASQNRLKYRTASFKEKRNHRNVRKLKYIFIHRKCISEKNSQTVYKEILVSSYKSQAIKTFWVCKILICNKYTSLTLDM